MTTRLEDILNRVRTWSPERQQDAIAILQTLEKNDEFSGLFGEQGQDFEQRLKQAYEEGIASGDAGEIDVDALLAEFAEQAGRSV